VHFFNKLNFHQRISAEAQFGSSISEAEAKASDGLIKTGEGHGKVREAALEFGGLFGTGSLRATPFRFPRFPRFLTWTQGWLLALTPSSMSQGGCQGRFGISTFAGAFQG